MLLTEKREAGEVDDMPMLPFVSIVSAVPVDVAVDSDDDVAM